MKCEICGKPVLLNEYWISPRRQHPLCHGCADKVVAYIESLKPKVVVERFPVSGDYLLDDGNPVRLPVALADALYEYMRRET